MAGRRAFVPVVHVTAQADGRYAIAVNVGAGPQPMETQPNRKAALARANDWIRIHRAHPHPVWHEEDAE